jgi:AraC family transcriptional regulator
MSDRQSSLKFAAPGFELWDVRCRARRAAASASDAEYVRTAQIVFPQRGVFEIDRLGESTIAAPGRAHVLAPGETYRVSHPTDRGDRCLVVALGSDVLSEHMELSRSGACDVAPTTMLSVNLLAAGASRPGVTPLQAEETSFALIDAITRDLRGAPPESRPLSRASRRRVERVRALVASDPTRDWRLTAIAETVHCSRSHLAREFAAGTGITLHRYVVRLRLAMALDRLARGERDLSRLAADLGFANHSHLTARFRSSFGFAPSAVRSMLRDGHVADFRTIVTAGVRPPR